MKKALALCSLTLILTATGCAWWKGDSAKKDAYNQLAEQAENEIKLANKTGFAWTNSDKFLQESKAAINAALAAGDKATRESEYNKAMKLAKKALQEAKLAQQQAKDNANPDVRF